MKWRYGMILITDLFLNDCKPIKSGINLIGADTVMSAQSVCVCGWEGHIVCFVVGVFREKQPVFRVSLIVCALS